MVNSFPAKDSTHSTQESDRYSFKRDTYAKNGLRPTIDYSFLLTLTDAYNNQLNNNLTIFKTLKNFLNLKAEFIVKEIL